MNSSPRDFLILVTAALALQACASSASQTGSTTGGGTGGGGPVIPPDSYVFDSAEFQIAVGQEKYMCTTVTVDEAMAIDRFIYESTPGVHHLVLVDPLVAEQSGSFECDVLFKQTWIPVFANGTGSVDVSTPAGSAFNIKAKDQLLVQLHLLNTTGAPLSGSARLIMHKNSQPNLIPAGIYGFGTQVFTLPPQQKTTVTNDCVLDKDIQAFSGFPHMHKLGSSLSFWSGPDANTLTKQFSVDTWSFGEQAIYPLKLNLSKGTTTRVTCDFNNTTSAQVGFGETTADEMCYFVTFIAPWTQLDGCVKL